MLFLALNKTLSFGKKKRRNKKTKLYQFFLIDNDYTSYESVIVMARRSLALDFDEAFLLAHEIDHKGKALAFEGPLKHCERLLEAFKRIKLEGFIIEKGKKPGDD